MLIEYKAVKAQLYFCSKTKSYYGEACLLDTHIIFQATSRHDAVLSMQAWIDAHINRAS